MTYTLVMRRFSALAVTATAVVVLGACGASTSDVVPSSSAAPVETSVNKPDVTARIIGDGSSFSLQEAIAELPVAFWFWAPG